jgi:DNA-binding transcriptional ArsR family regulator
MMSPGFRSLMWYLLRGTRGGPNRFRILEELRLSPANAHQLAAAVDLDYRTVRHHLKLLEKNGAIARPVGDAYAAPFELTPYVAEHFDELEEILRSRRRPTRTLPRRAPALVRAAEGGR